MPLEADAISRHSWLPRTRRRYTEWAALLTAAMTALLAVAGPLPVTLELWLMVAVVALLGLPHGAFDMEIGRRLFQPRWPRSWSLRFVGLYLAAAGLGVVAWILAPTVCLVLLLVVGVLHWGHEDVEFPPATRSRTLLFAAARGLVPVVVPCAAHPETVAEIFTALRMGAVVDPVVVLRLSGVVLLIGAPVLAWSLTEAVRRGPPGRPVVRWLPVIEVIVLTAWLTIAPPLLGFTVYFCLWHSVRHSLASAAVLEPRRLGAALRRYVVATLPATVATIIAAAAVAALVPAPDGWSPLMVSIVFIGLFALTIPHVILDLATHRPARS